MEYNSILAQQNGTDVKSVSDFSEQSQHFQKDDSPVMGPIESK